LGYQIFRESDGVIYSPDIEVKAGFAYSSARGLHLWASSSIPGIEASIEEVFLHLNLLVKGEIAGGGTVASTPPEEDPDDDPDDDTDKPGKGGPKGNNGIGNGVDDQPPGNPPVNDDEDAVGDGNASGGKGKKK
jgi:hypothetical protein